MLCYVTIVTVLLMVGSAHARSYPTVPIATTVPIASGPVKFTASNATFMAVANELGIGDVLKVLADSPLYGGNGGSPFNSQDGAVQGIRIRSGAYIDSIQVVYENGQVSGVYGGTGGGPASIDLARGERIVTIQGRSGAYVDSLTFISNWGRVYGPYGGGGGSPFVVSNCNLSGIFGRSGSLLDAIGFHC